ADATRGRVGPHQRRELCLDLLVAPAQCVIVRVRDGRRVVLVIALVMLADLSSKPLELGFGLRLGEIGDGAVAVGSRTHGVMRALQVGSVVWSPRLRLSA